MTIITPTATGIFSDYVASDYDFIDAVRSSDLRLINEECPAVYKYETENREDKDQFDIGKAAHLLFLEKHLFDQSIVHIDADDWRKKEVKEQRDAARQDGKIPLNNPQLADVQEMRAYFEKDAAAQAIMKGCAIEQTILWQDAETGLWCKARPDGLGKQHMVDYKTAASCRPADFQQALGNHGYYQQIAHYLDGYEAATGEKIIDFIFLVQRKKAPHILMPFRADAEAIAKGRERNRAAMRVLAKCKETNDWYRYREPGVDKDSIITLSLKPWLIMQLEEQSAAEKK